MDAAGEVEAQATEEVRRIRLSLKLLGLTPICLLVGAFVLAITTDDVVLKVVAGAAVPLITIGWILTHVALKKRLARLTGQQLSAEELLT